MEEVTKNILKEVYQKRHLGVKKYDFGILIVIGGSEFYSGAPALSSLAAFRAGVDMVRIIAPERAANIIASFSPTLAAYPLEGKRLNKDHLSILISIVEGARAVTKNVALAIGGGAGRSKETQDVIVELLEKISIPAVIDADAIYAVAKKPEIFKGKPFLFTPHTYEFFVLTGKEVIGKSDYEKIELVIFEAKRLQTTILLKGKIDIISNGKEAVLNKTGSPYMTKGGTGDTLAGIAAALMARGITPFKAAQAAAYINGKAGELASSKKKEGLLATDLIELIPEVLK